ncbi:MAG: phenylacetate-CoA oxygenase subunit PaaC [Anaerolineae bacterium]|nr:phenylacetate-CoA oxygenase subunit PaaC [Anaerolineae bacterium]
MSNTLPPNLQSSIFDYILALADDELVIGHRASEWTGLGPILEEDIAFSSIAQDELGHALTFYTLLEGLDGGDADDLAFLRGSAEFRNAQLCELPRGDFAFSLVRHFLYDLAEAVRLDRLADSAYPPLAQAAAKIRQEEKYHLMHGRTWVQKLARGGDEARAHLQTALDLAYPAAAGLFEPVEDEAELVAAGLVPPSAEVAASWREVVVPFLSSAGFTVPVGTSHLGGRYGQHTEYLSQLLDAMQALYRTDPEASW